jgi:hypothetical protein
MAEVTGDMLAAKFGAILPHLMHLTASTESAICNR